jgi:hypothetical protein
MDHIGTTRGQNWLFEDDPQKDEVIKDVIDYNAEILKGYEYHTEN